jgi:formate dehydrogenase accessory protein FdhE
MTELWDKSIARAEHLSSLNEGSKGLLNFYARLLRTQKRIYESLLSRKDSPPSGRIESDLPALRPLLPMLLDTVGSTGPAELAAGARKWLQAGEDEIDEMLLEYWRAPADTHFFAKAFLQPYARSLAEIGVKLAERTLTRHENQCPFCAGRPQLTFLQAIEHGSEGGGCNMICATCLTVWPFRRVVCANCGEERPANLAYYHSVEYDHIRVEACEICRSYIKGIDLTRLGLAVPLVDEVAAAALDLWASEHGYTKIELNLVGL